MKKWLRRSAIRAQIKEHNNLSFNAILQAVVWMSIDTNISLSWKAVYDKHMEELEVLKKELADTYDRK